jgi:serine/threonine protein phosphatase PrpC
MAAPARPEQPRADAPGAAAGRGRDTAAAPSHLAGGLRICAGQATEAGGRPANEDCMGLRIPEPPLLTFKGAAAVIADGVSSAEAGREASETCVQSFLTDYFSTPEPWSVRTSAQRVLTALNRWLYSQGRHLPEARRGYITTLSILVVKSERAHVFHVGDSRIYQLRAGRLSQLTTDHCAAVGTRETYLTRAMGMDVRLEIDYSEIELRRGDLFLLTTDGVHGYLPHETLRQVALQAGDDLEAACRELLARAAEAGSPDNRTCQMLRVEQLPLENPDEVYRRLSELPFPPPLAPGMRVDGYEVEAELHASSRSQVYRVRDPASGQRYAMKTPSVNFEDDESYIDRFLIEPWIGRRIHSPHVARVIEPPRPASCLYYLQEYVQGCTLGEWMSAHPQPEIRAAVALIEQIGRGLQAFHRRETTHRDLKPDNVMIDREGVAKIIDLGACHIAGIHEIALPIPRDSVLGTARYAAPECRMGFGAHPRADLFSLATIAYELLTGALPYGSAIETARSPADFARLRYTPSYTHNPMIPVWLDAALRRAVALEPEARYGELSEFLADLRKPNPRYLREVRAPLVERDPARFWQRTALALVLLELLTLWLWLSARAP